MNSKHLVPLVLGSILFMGTGIANAAPAPVPAPATDAGTELNTLRHQLEMEQANEHIEEARQREESGVTNNVDDKAVKETAEVRFVLNKVQFSESKVLSDAELTDAAKDYVNKEISLKDINGVIANVNKLYRDKGYVTCQAVLEPQTIKNGILVIRLIERKNGGMKFIESKSTRTYYYRGYLHINKDEVANTNQINDDLLRFNTTNDVRMKITMKAGSEPNTIDYEIAVADPPNNETINIFGDNAGGYSTGIYRQGIFYTNKSLIGRRDPLSLGFVRSRGTEAATVGYSIPINSFGTRLNASYSTNAVKSVKDGNEYNTSSTLGVFSKGHSNSISIGISVPEFITPKCRMDLGLDYSRQKSSSDSIYINGSDTFRISNTSESTIDEFTGSITRTNYGSSYAFYQRHSLSYDKADVNSDLAPKEFLNYRFIGMYQKWFQHGQSFTLKGSLGWASEDNIDSSRRFYIGGVYSVRGYRENFLNGETGYFLNLEYAVPFTKDRKTNGYIFYDYGNVLGESADKNVNHVLASCGFGVRTKIANKYSANLVFAFPLRKSFHENIITMPDASRMYVHFNVSAQF